MEHLETRPVHREDGDNEGGAIALAAIRGIVERVKGVSVAIKEGLDQRFKELDATDDHSVPGMRVLSPREEYEKTMRSVVRLSDVIGPEETRRIAEEERSRRLAAHKTRIHRLRQKGILPRRK